MIWLQLRGVGEISHLLERHVGLRQTWINTDNSEEPGASMVRLESLLL
jgi:hypothetical protein